MCPKRQSCPVLPGLIINVQSLWSLRMGVFRSLGGSRPVRLAGYINQDETAILCGVWEFVGQEPNNSVYLAPIGFADVVLSSILLLISYHTPILLGDFHFYIIKTPKSYARIVENSPLIWSLA